MKGKTLVFVLSIVVIVLSNHANAQHKRMKKKDSDSRGTLFGYWGYNRTKYTKSDIRFVGPGYDFTLAGAKAHDNPSTNIREYFNPTTLTVPQFNARVGYYIKDHLAISLGYDHMKYIFADQNEVYLSGSIDPGVDNTTNWSGTYNVEPITTDRSTFHYENSDGLNFIRAELTRTDRWLKFGPKQEFVISTNIGASFGTILSYNDLNFAGLHTYRTISFSGMGMALHVSPRFEFFRHLFIQPQLSAGYMKQIKVQTRPNDPSSYAKHGFIYSELSAVVGFFLYIRPANGCDTCPVWD